MCCGFFPPLQVVLKKKMVKYKKENWKCMAKREMKYFVKERGLTLLNSLLLWRQASD